MTETRRQEPLIDKGKPRLPRHVEDFLGQVLRNRLHDTVLSPFPDTMAKLLEAMRRRDKPSQPSDQN